MIKCQGKTDGVECQFTSEDLAGLLEHVDHVHGGWVHKSQEAWERRFLENGLMAVPTWK